MHNLASALAQGILNWLLFIPLLTFHEWAHAWTAWKFGDDTAKNLGRVSLNPVVHMELIGTVILPLLSIVSGVFGGIGLIGWGRPVPVNINNLPNPRVQDSLIALAGPAMNILLAILLLILVKVANAMGNSMLAEIFSKTAFISVLLAVFNMIPIPPLDGSHLLAHLTRMSYEMYARLASYGFIALLILINIPATSAFLWSATSFVFIVLARLLRLDIG